MDVLNLPRPGWMTEELALLEQQVRRFIAAEYVPHLDRWNEQGMYERDVWNKAGAAGLLCPSIPEEYGGPGGSFAHEAVIGRELSLAGFDSFGAGLHSGIVALHIRRCTAGLRLWSCRILPLQGDLEQIILLR